MNKTLHKKLTDKNQYTYPSYLDITGTDDLIPGFKLEKKIIKEAAKDLLSPRPEVVNRLLKLSRTI